MKAGVGVRRGRRAMPAASPPVFLSARRRSCSWPQARRRSSSWPPARCRSSSWSSANRELRSSANRGAPVDCDRSSANRELWSSANRGAPVDCDPYVRPGGHGGSWAGRGTTRAVNGSWAGRGATRAAWTKSMT